MLTFSSKAKQSRIQAVRHDLYDVIDVTLKVLHVTGLQKTSAKALSQNSFLTDVLSNIYFYNGFCNLYWQIVHNFIIYWLSPIFSPSRPNLHNDQLMQKRAFIGTSQCLATLYVTIDCKWTSVLQKYFAHVYTFWILTWMHQPTKLPRVLYRRSSHSKRVFYRLCTCGSGEKTIQSIKMIKLWPSTDNMHFCFLKNP